MTDAARETDYSLFFRLQTTVEAVREALAGLAPDFYETVSLTGLKGDVPTLNIHFSPDQQSVDLDTTGKVPLIRAPAFEKAVPMLFEQGMLNRELTFLFWADYHLVERSVNFERNKQRRNLQYTNEPPVVDAMVQMALARIWNQNGGFPHTDLFLAMIDVIGRDWGQFSEINIEKINFRMQLARIDIVGDDREQRTASHVRNRIAGGES